MRTSAAREEQIERGGRGEARRDAPGVPLAELCEKRTGVRNPGDRPDQPFRYVDISAVDNQTKRITSPQSLQGRNAPSRARNILREGDVLVATTRPNLNAVAMVPADLDDQICSTGFCVLRAGPRIRADYLFQFVQSAAFVQPLSDLVKGALYPAVNDSQVLALEIPLPPLAEQERIAGWVSRGMEQAAAARRAALDRLAAAEALPAALLREVFEGPQAQEWETVPLGELALIIAGQSPPGSTYRQEPVGLPFFQGKADFGLRHPIARVWCTEPKKIAQPGDVLMSIRAPVGPTNVANMACCIGRGLAALRCGDRLNRDYLLWFLRCIEEEIAKSGSGSTFHAINRDQLDAIEVPLPPLAEQERIAADLGGRLAAAEGVIAQCREELAAIEALPAALLRAAFNGVS